jgi:hypothetical protein
MQETRVDLELFLLGLRINQYRRDASHLINLPVDTKGGNLAIISFILVELVGEMIQSQGL